MKIKTGVIVSVLTLGFIYQSSAMQFNDDFDGYAVGDLSAATTNWVAAVWDANFDVIDDMGDQKVQHNGANNYTLVAVNPDAFTLEPGEDLAITNIFSSTSSGWARGVFFNYSRPGITIDAYTAYITPVSGQLAVKIDKWDDSSNAGSGITNILTATGLGAASLMAGDGMMVVTYDADKQTIGIEVSIDGDFSFSTNLVDRSFVGGRVGLYGKSASAYTIEEFTVNGFQDPVEPRYVSRLFFDDFNADAEGDLSVSTNWASGIWDGDFDVVDADGDKVAQLNRANRVSMVTVDPSAFAVVSGDNFVITNRFSSDRDNWYHGVAFNYERTTNNTVNMYSLSLTRNGADNKEIFVNLDKWENANNTGTHGVTNLFSIGTGAGNWDDLNTNGVMVISYDAATAEIRVQIGLETGFWFATSLIDSSFDSGQVGLYGKLSEGYVVHEFSASIYSQIFPPPVIGIEAVSANLFKLVIDLNQSSELNGYAPVVRDVLTDGSWVAVPHSDDGIHSFVETNLTYSTTNGLNRVIYVQSANSTGFFGLQ